MGRADFEDEAVSSLRNLGYSDDEIAKTNGQLPSEMAAEDRLRLSLRALSAEHSRQAQEKAVQGAPAPNPKVFPGPATDDSDEYWRGRRDAAALSKTNQPPKQPRQRTQRQPARKKQASPLASYKKMNALARKARGRRR
jgi:hypothetical protein